MGVTVTGEMKRGTRNARLASFLCTAAILAAVPGPSFAQNLIANGNFAVNGGNSSHTASPWVGLGGQLGGIWICVFPASCGFGALTPTPNGSNAVAWLTAGPVGGTNGIGQTVNLTNSGRYQFSFYHELIPFAGPTAPNLKATVGGQTVFNGPDTATAWTLSSTTLKLNTGANAVDFFGMYGGGFNAFISDVSLIFLGPTALTPLLPQSAPVNAVKVAGGIDNFLNNGGLLTGGFQSLNFQSGQALVNSLVQLDGETSTGAEKGAFQLTNQFLGLMLDPYVDGRFGAGTSSFAPDREAALPPDIAMAYASVLKAPPRVVDNRWSVWGTGFGGSSHAGGDPNIGSSDVTANTYGFASGADYHFTRDTLLGFALAGAGTNWGLSQLLGSGRSDAFQAGVYGRTAWGPVYLAAALAYTENWFTTNRIALGDQLTSKFNGESFGGRLEGGYRYVVPSNAGQFEIVPYAAVQAQSFHTPSYSEADLSGGGLGLNFNAMNATDTRSELGTRFADMTAVNGMPLILRAKLAWAHDWVDNTSLNAIFQTLPGSSFTVNGAPIPSDSALASVGAELHMTTHWSAAAKFDGEFAKSSQTYAGTGTLRYAW
jgi:Autotransporter beta-domain